VLRLESPHRDGSALRFLVGGDGVRRADTGSPAAGAPSRVGPVILGKSLIGYVWRAVPGYRDVTLALSPDLGAPTRSDDTHAVVYLEASPLSAGEMERPLDAERRRELSSHGSLEDLTGRAGGTVEVGMRERRPPAVVALDEVRDEDMPMQERVAGTARPVPERRANDTARRDAARTMATGGFGIFGSQPVEPCLVVRAALCPDCFAFEPRDRFPRSGFAGASFAAAGCTPSARGR